MDHRVESILVPSEAVGREILSDDVYERFVAAPDLTAIPVVADRRPIGLLERHIFLLHYAQPYRRELYGRRPVVSMIAVDTINMECATPVDTAVQMIAARGGSGANISFTLTRDGDYAGVAHIIDLMRLSAELSDRRAQEAEVERNARAAQAALLSGVLEGIDQGLVAFDPQGRMVTCNARLPKMLGMVEDCAANCCGGSLAEFLEQEATLGGYEKLPILATGAGSPVYERVRRDGTVLNIVASPTPDGGLVIAYTDATELRCAEEARQQARRLMRDVIDSVPAMINAKDRDSRYVFMNSFQADAYGVSPEQAIGRTAGDLLGPERGLFTRTRDLEVLHTNRPTNFYEDTYADARGKRRTWLFRKTPLRDERGESTMVATIGLDITSRKLAEEALQASEEQMRRLFEFSPVGMCVASARGRLAQVNQAFLDLVGRTGIDAASMALTDFIRPADRAILNAALDQLKTGEIHYAVPEVRLVHSDGREIFAQLMVTPLADAAGADDQFIVQSIDVTARKLAAERLEEMVVQRTAELQRMNAELEQALADTTRARESADAASRAKSDFLAAMSHERRTPMNGVLGMLELLNMTRLDTQQADLVRVVRESSSSLLTIIDDILDFSKIEAGKLEIEHVPFSPLALVEGVAEVLGPSAHKKKLSLMSFVDPATPAQLRGDPVRLRQILFNLVGNAVKFTAQGRVVIRTSVEPSGGRLRLRIEVADTGIGLTPDAIQRLFNPFVQADGTTTRRYGGTGLGLAICKRLATAMGGDIAIASEPGRGSQFVLTLAVDAHGAGGDSRAGLLNGARILVVDDDPNFAEIAAAYLRAVGAEAAVAADAADALAKLRVAAAEGRGFDAAVVDQILPDQPGTKLLQAMRRDAATANVKSLLLTAFPQEDQRRRTLSQGISAYLTKPVRRDLMIDEVAMALGRGAATPARVKPAERNAAVEPPKAPTIEEARRTGQLILVAEDNPTNQRVVAMQLGRLGYAAEITPHGGAALAAWRQGAYAMLITDCHMPEMDGIELCQAIRQDERDGARAPLPIVAMTANALSGEAERCLEAGMDDFLAKPVNLKQLAEVVARWMPDKAAPPVEEAPATEAPAEQSAVLDLERFRACVGEIDDQAGAVFDLFLDSTRSMIGDLRRGIAARDVETTHRAAHSMKGAANTAGALELGWLAETIEHAAESENWPFAADQHARLDGAYARVAGEIARLIGAAQPSS